MKRGIAEINDILKNLALLNKDLMYLSEVNVETRIKLYIF